MEVLYNGEKPEAIIEYFLYETQSVELGVELRRFLILGLVLFTLLIQPLASADESTNSVVYRIQKTYLVSNDGSVAATNVVVAPLFIFDNRSGWASQQVLSEDIQLSDPLDSYEIIPTGDNRIVRALLGTITDGASKTIVITQVVKVDYVDLGITPDMVQGSIPADELQYTQPVAHLWESDDSEIYGKAHELIDNYSNYYHKSRQIFDFVKDYLTYVLCDEEHSALWAYTNRTGDCSEYTHLFIALARAAGIPAKYVSGYGYQPQLGTDFEHMGHAWAFAYLPGVEWVPIDTRWGTPEWNFCKLSPDHLILTTSDGTDLVEEGQIKISGDCSRPSYSYSEPNPNLTVDRTVSTITREVAVEVTLDAVSQIENGSWSWYATVKNMGTRTIENIQVRLQADQTYFEVPAAQTIDSLLYNHNQMVSFDVSVKDIGLEQGVENSTITALVTYDTPYGSFMAEGKSLANITPRVIPPMTIDPMLIFLIVVIAVSAIAISAALRR